MKAGEKPTHVASNLIDIIKTDEEDPALREKRIALTGRVAPGEWYGWHSAYVAPFAYKDRLYIRTFDDLYCFEGGSGSGGDR